MILMLAVVAVVLIVAAVGFTALERGGSRPGLCARTDNGSMYSPNDPTCFRPGDLSVFHDD